jgi:hypothetical protein
MLVESGVAGALGHQVTRIAVAEKRRGPVMKIRSNSDPGRSPRFVIGWFTWSWEFRPRGYHTGAWIMIPPIWIRLGRRKYWETEMITPVKPPRGQR